MHHLIIRENNKTPSVRDTKTSDPSPWTTCYKELNLLHTVDVIQTSEPNYKELFPKVFTGLGKLEGAYKIKLKESTTPFALSVPSRVPLPMMNKVKEELKEWKTWGSYTHRRSDRMVLRYGCSTKTKWQDQNLC